MAHTNTFPVEIDQETLELMALTAWTVASPGGRAFVEAGLRAQGALTPDVAAAIDAMDRLVTSKGDAAPTYIARLARRAGLDLTLNHIEGGLH